MPLTVGVVETRNDLSICAVEENLSFRIRPTVDVDVASLHIEWEISEIQLAERSGFSSRVKVHSSVRI